MENKEFKSKLRTILAMRNFSKTLEMHYKQKMQKEKTLNERHKTLYQQQHFIIW